MMILIVFIVHVHHFCSQYFNEVEYEVFYEWNAISNYKQFAICLLSYMYGWLQLNKYEAKKKYCVALSNWLSSINK